MKNKTKVYIQLIEETDYNGSVVRLQKTVEGTVRMVNKARVAMMDLAYRSNLKYVEIK